MGNRRIRRVRKGNYSEDQIEEVTCEGKEKKVRKELREGVCVEGERMKGIKEGMEMDQAGGEEERRGVQNGIKESPEQECELEEEQIFLLPSSRINLSWNS